MAIAWRITNRCNLGKCFFCRIGPKSTTDKHELKLKRVKQICLEYTQSTLIDKKLKKIYFTGGEPFIRNDMANIIKYITCDLNIQLSIVTNGLLIDHNVINALKNKNVEVNISLDGLEVDHNKIRRSNVFNNTVLTIKELIRNDIIVDLLPTITRFNYKSFFQDEFINLLNNDLLGVRFVALSRIDFIGYGKTCQNHNISDRLFIQLYNHLNLGAVNTKVITRKARIPSLRIDCEGNVYSLAEMEGKPIYFDGNLKKQTLNEIISFPSYFWLFHKSNYSKERIIWELLQLYDLKMNSDKIYFLDAIIDLLDSKSYMG